jgi:peptidoglycan/xylan/chitin deacetylase (PgdA/CDA1 family)
MAQALRICFNPRSPAKINKKAMRKSFILNTLFLAAFALCFCPRTVVAGTTIAEDRSSAVILAYHRIGEDAWPDTSLRTDQFVAHIEELTGGGYNVMALPAILTALENDEKLPPNTIAITFEGAYQSAYENGMTMLLQKNIPFTVFFAADNADNGAGQYMGWAALRSLNRSELVSLGILPASYTRLAAAPRADILTQVNKAKIRFREEFGQEAALFSYPFGEYSLAYKKIISELGFDAAFGLQSGVAAPFSDFMALPRFTMTEIYGDLERFRMVTNALPLPAADIEPQNPFLNTNTPSIGFSLAAGLVPEKRALSCHVSGQDVQPDLEFLGESRVELRLAQPVTEERTRVNCTMPGPLLRGEPQGWRWLGMLLVHENPVDTAGNNPSLQPDEPL